MGTPLKRHPALVPLSKDHHFGLLLCWKIRVGLKRNVAPERIARYVLYFFENHLKPHFREEEAHIFTLLQETDERRKKAEQQHRRIIRLIENLTSEPSRVTTTLGQIEEEVDGHIRFEERDLFQFIQQSLPLTELQMLEKKITEIHEMKPEVWEDQFWGK